MALLDSAQSNGLILGGPQKLTLSKGAVAGGGGGTRIASLVGGFEQFGDFTLPLGVGPRGDSAGLSDLQPGRDASL